MQGSWQTLTSGASPTQYFSPWCRRGAHESDDFASPFDAMYKRRSEQPRTKDSSAQSNLLSVAEGRVCQNEIDRRAIIVDSMQRHHLLAIPPELYACRSQCVLTSSWKSRTERLYVHNWASRRPIGPRLLQRERKES